MTPLASSSLPIWLVVEPFGTSTLTTAPGPPEGLICDFTQNAPPPTASTATAATIAVIIIQREARAGTDSGAMCSPTARSLQPRLEQHRGSGLVDDRST